MRAQSEQAPPEPDRKNNNKTKHNYETLSILLDGRAGLCRLYR